MTDGPGAHDFGHSFALESPQVCLAWGIAEADAERLLRGARVRGVGHGRLRARCQLLGGFETELEFRFRPRNQGRLVQVELMRSPQRRRRQAFENLQELLVRWLGPGTPGPPRTIGEELVQIVPSAWKVGDVTVTHDYYYQGAQYEKVLFSWAG